MVTPLAKVASSRLIRSTAVFSLSKSSCVNAAEAEVIVMLVGVKPAELSASSLLCNSAAVHLISRLYTSLVPLTRAATPSERQTTFTPLATVMGLVLVLPVVVTFVKSSICPLERTEVRSVVSISLRIFSVVALDEKLVRLVPIALSALLMTPATTVELSIVKLLVVAILPALYILLTLKSPGLLLYEDGTMKFSKVLLLPSAIPKLVTPSHVVLYVTAASDKSNIETEEEYNALSVANGPPPPLDKITLPSVTIFTLFIPLFKPSNIL